VFTARYALSPYIKQIHFVFVFKGLIRSTEFVSFLSWKMILSTAIKGISSMLTIIDTQPWFGQLEIRNSFISTVSAMPLRSPAKPIEMTRINIRYSFFMCYIPCISQMVKTNQQVSTTFTNNIMYLCRRISYMFRWSGRHPLEPSKITGSIMLLSCEKFHRRSRPPCI
jgi:hypothetical protein